MDAMVAMTVGRQCRCRRMRNWRKFPRPTILKCRLFREKRAPFAAATSPAVAPQSVCSHIAAAQATSQMAIPVDLKMVNAPGSRD